MAWLTGVGVGTALCPERGLRGQRDRDVHVEGRACEHLAPLGLSPIGPQESGAQSLGSATEPGCSLKGGTLPCGGSVAALSRTTSLCPFFCVLFLRTAAKLVRLANALCCLQLHVVCRCCVVSPGGLDHHLLGDASHY